MVSRKACPVGETGVFNAFPSRRLIRARQQPGVGSNGSIRYPSYSVIRIDLGANSSPVGRVSLHLRDDDPKSEVEQGYRFGPVLAFE